MGKEFIEIDFVMDEIILTIKDDNVDFIVVVSEDDYESYAVAGNILPDEDNVDYYLDRIMEYIDNYNDDMKDLTCQKNYVDSDNYFDEDDDIELEDFSDINDRICDHLKKAMDIISREDLINGVDKITE